MSAEVLKASDLASVSPRAKAEVSACYWISSVPKTFAILVLDYELDLCHNSIMTTKLRGGVRPGAGRKPIQAICPWCRKRLLGPAGRLC